MRVAVFYVFLLVSAGPAMAQTTPEELRAMAYAGDIEGAEAALAQAHQQTLDGTLAYDDLRALVSILIVTHPDVVDFVGDWLEAYPESPYAKTLRVFHMQEAAWHIRGNGLPSDTHPQAIATFRAMQHRGMELARSAYRDAPDYILASDAVFTHQKTTHQLNNDELFAMLQDVIAVTPSRDSLYRAMMSAQSNWGGSGYRGMVALCEIFAERITDVENYTPEVCSIDMIHALQRTPLGAEYTYYLLDDHDHPILALAHARRALERRSEEDRATVLAYLSRPEVLDEKMAERFTLSFRNDGESEAVMRALDERLQAFADDGLLHDPFHPRVMDIASFDYHILSYRSYVPDRNQRALFAKRRAVISPYSAANWEQAANKRTENHDIFIPSQYDPYYINAIFYSDHGHRHLRDFLFEKTSFYDLYRTAPDFGMEVDITEETLQVEVLCPITRLTRLTEAACQAQDIDERDCISLTFAAQSYEIALADIKERQICEFERTVPLKELLYEPVQVDVGALNAGMANR